MSGPKRLISWCIIFLFLIICIHPGYGQGISRWTGTLTLEDKFTGITGTSTRNLTVTFNDALPTLHRNDGITNLNFTDDKGTGSSSYHAEGIIAGKKLSTTDCQGSGQSELHEVVINQGENTYYIYAIAPACSGKTISHIGLPAKDYGPETTEIIIKDKKIVDKNRLSGSSNETFDIAGTGTLVRTLTWNLEKAKDDAILIVTPENYDNWMPEPGKNEAIKGNSIKINLKVVGKNGQAPVSKVKSFEVKLNNTSKEPGITLNAPVILTTPLHDLRFIPQLNTELEDELQSATIQCKDGITGNITIASYDGGAYTSLTAVAILQDNSRLEGHLLVPGGTTTIPVPKRNSGSNIAEAWFNAHNKPDDLFDDETSANNNNNGDGLTAYEEYRGVISKGKFIRLDPDQKELAVLMKPAEAILFQVGLDWFEGSTGLNIIPFEPGEIGVDRMLNKNHKTAHSYDQYALHLLKGHVKKNVMGRAVNGPGLPRQVSQVIIDHNQIVQKQTQLEAEALAAKISLPFNLGEMLAKTVAHELGHGVNIQHHGNHELQEIDRVIQKGEGIFVFLPRGHTEITERPYHLKGSVGKTGGQQSGDVFCIMNYNPYYDFSLIEKNHTSTFYIVPFLPLTNGMCNDKAGTDINATAIYFGNATNGDCIGQVKLK